MDTKEIMDTLLESFEKEGNVKVCFGDPIDKQGITFIPVAKIDAKGGGGSGSANKPLSLKKTDDSTEITKESLEEEIPDQDKNKPIATGQGLGINITATPLGYIEVKEGNAEYKPIKDHDRLAIAGLVYAGVSIFVITRTICFIVRALSRKQRRVIKP